MDTLDIGKEKRLVPVLRFEEFDGEWEKKLFEETYSFRTTNSFSRDKLNYYQGKVKNIHYGDIHTKFDSYFDITKEKVPYINEDINLSKISEENYCKEKDLVIADASEDYADIGKSIELINLNDEKVLAGLHTFVARPDQNDLAKGFGSFIMQSWFIRKQIMTIAQGTKVLGLSKIRLAKINTLIPERKEQKKIATFLSAIDKKIQQLTRKKALLEHYKKGLMQQLFSGALRFTDEEGKDYPDWEEKLYGDIFSFYPTNSFSRVNLNYESGTVKNIHYGDIHTKFSTLFNIREEVVPYVNSEINTTKIKEECYCQEGDLIIADASEDYSDIGKAIELIELSNEKLVAGLHTFLARPNKTKMYVGFSGYLVQAWYIRKQIMTIAQGTKVLSLSTRRLAKLKVNIPCLEEQQKIATYLSSIDTKIETITTQITKTQTFKKGLLQQMFV